MTISSTGFVGIALGWGAFVFFVAMTIWFYVCGTEIPTEAEILREWDGSDLETELADVRRVRGNYWWRTLISALAAVAFLVIGIFSLAL